MVGNQLSMNNIWSSKLVWRVAIALFLVILAVNSVFSFMKLEQYKKDRLFDMEELGLYTIIPALADASFDQTQPPIDQKTANRLISNTPLRGLAFYNVNYDLVGSSGENVSLIASRNSAAARELFNEESGIFEVVYIPRELGISHFIVASFDAAPIISEMSRQIELEIIIVILLSMFVTLVLIIALSKWFLDPVIYLYKRLALATKDPENPPEMDRDFHDKTEIGRAIEAADVLMTNNADSIKRIKAMAESEVNRLAYFDTLTGLPNRISFLNTLKETLAETDEHFLDRYAVLTMNVDHFKDINDTMGHAIGDEVLKAFGKRLSKTVPENAVVSRLSADEFAVMVPLSGGEDEGLIYANEIIEAFRNEAIEIMDENFQIRCSVGIAVCPEDSDNPEEVLKCADIALNRAKTEGRDRAKRYDGTYTEDIQKRFQILRDLRVAMDHEDLELFYQPQIDMASGKLIGAEALIRWFKKNENGDGATFISPVDFIPVAEQSGLILPLGDWIMRKACETAKAWSDEGMGDLSIAVNVSGHQFLEKDLVQKIERIIIDTGIKPHQLEVEVTESVFMEDTDHSIKMLKDIQAMGVPIAIDDFGTGYSSLSYLQRFPMDKLKIDRAFIRYIDEQRDNLVLTKTIIALCKTMNLKVVAEGVETGAEEKILINEACDIGQGYRYSPPIPDSKFREFAKNYTGKLNYFDKAS
jgi:diguanylate cyclase (GGDEF)-like protein